MSAQISFGQSHQGAKASRAFIFVVGLLWAATAQAAPVTYWSLVSGVVVSQGHGFVSDVQRNGTFASSGEAFLSDPSRLESWSGSADLTTGALRQTSETTIAASGAGPFLDGYTVVNLGVGDTISYAGVGTGGIDNVTARLTLTGSWNEGAPGTSSVNGQGRVQVFFFAPGEYGTNLVGDTRLAYQEWAINAGSTFPSVLTLPVPIASLPSGFRVAVVLSTSITGSNPDGDGLFWNVNLGNTLRVDLLAPDGYTLTSAGGLPTVNADASPVPEPATLLLLGVGLAIVALRRR